MTKKSVIIGAKPSARKAVTGDQWVTGAEQKKVATTRYTIDIPTELHGRIKSQCALKHVKMREEIIMLLERHFKDNSL
jgi:ABC-type thiamine transport system ATPase subunit